MAWPLLRDSGMPWLALFLSLVTLYVPTVRAAPLAERPGGGYPVAVAVGGSHTLVVPGLRRAAVGSSKLLRVTALPPSTLLLTGVQPGRTLVRAWNEAGDESLFEVEVQPPEARPAEDGAGVVKVVLEFLEVDSTLGESLGIRWPEALQFSAGGSLQGDLAHAGLNFAVPFTSAKGWIQHLSRNGWAKLLAKPELYVRLGEEARFHSGGEIPVSTSVSTTAGYHRQVDWKPYGLSVRVRPQSGDRLRISSDVRVEIAELNPAAGMDGVPALVRRNVETKMTSWDGETVVLSGLTRRVASADKEGLPLLAHIPGLDLLFAKRGRRVEETEIFMAVTFALTTRAAVRDRVGDSRSRLEAAGAP